MNKLNKDQINFYIFSVFGVFFMYSFVYFTWGRIEGSISMSDEMLLANLSPDEEAFWWWTCTCMSLFCTFWMLVECNSITNLSKSESQKSN